MEYCKASTGYAFNPTEEEVARECDIAWARARELREAGSTDEKIFEIMIAEHRELNKTYPTIIAGIASGNYSPRAVRKFFKYVRKHQWKTEAEFLDTQAAYNAILYRVLHPHSGGKDIARVRDMSREALGTNEEEMRKEVERAQKIAAENVARHASGRVEDLRARIPRDSEIILAEVVRPIRVAFDNDQ